jgi:hypothetical protein
LSKAFEEHVRFEVGGSLSSKMFTSYHNITWSHNQGDLNYNSKNFLFS